MTRRGIATPSPLATSAPLSESREFVHSTRPGPGFAGWSAALFSGRTSHGFVAGSVASVGPGYDGRRKCGGRVSRGSGDRRRIDPGAQLCRCARGASITCCRSSVPRTSAICPVNASSGWPNCLGGRAFADRPQPQERLTKQIADWLAEHLRPGGVGVVIEAEHRCMTLRGVRSTESATVTSALLGALRQGPRSCQEFFALAGVKS